MFRFYRKFYAPSRPTPANLAVYAGIAAKLALSVAANGVFASSAPEATLETAQRLRQPPPARGHDVFEARFPLVPLALGGGEPALDLAEIGSIRILLGWRVHRRGRMTQPVTG